MAKLLVVDDDTELSEALADHLRTKEGHIAEVCHNGEDALQLLQGFHYDLIVLDWTMPGISGDEVCKKYRQRGGQSPIVFLTGNSDIKYLESGFGAGADDYVVKPFEMRELTARIRALLKRRTGAFSDGLQVDGLVLNVESRSMSVGNKVIELRSKEAALLEFLMRNTNRVYTAQQLIEAVWSSDAEVTTGSVRTWMGLLRQKLTEAGKPDLIETLPRSGYTIRK